MMYSLIKAFIGGAATYIINSVVCDLLPDNTAGKVVKTVVPIATGSLVGGVLVSTPSTPTSPKSFTATMIDIEGNIVSQVSDGVNDGRWMDIYLDSNNNISTIDISGM